MRSRIGAAVTALVISAVVVAAPAWSAAASDGDPLDSLVTTTYEPDPSPDLENPERGLYGGVNSLAEAGAAPGDGFIGYARKGGSTVVHGFVDLSAYVDEPKIGSDVLDGLRQAFAKLRAGGVKVILRFTYSPSGTTQCGGGMNPGATALKPDGVPDARLDIILAHIEQLAAVVNNHSDIISSLEAGFLGEFGEWHCSVNSSAGQPPSNRNPIDESAKLQVIAAERAAFTAIDQIEMRYPRDIETVTTALEITGGIGSHQDCYAASPDDAGTWEPGPLEPQQEAIGALSPAAVGATVCLDYPERTNCPTALVEMPRMHFSYLERDFYQPGLALYQANATGLPPCWETIRASLGYRLQLTSAQLPAALTPGEVAPVSITLQNVGWAAPFNPRPALLVLDGPGGRAEIPLPEVDPTTWAAGSTVTIAQDVLVPSDLPAGDYRLSLWLPDAAAATVPQLAHSAFAIHLANLDVWDAATGLNVLAPSVAVGASLGEPPAPPSPSPTPSPAPAPPAPPAAPAPHDPPAAPAPHDPSASPPGLAATGSAPLPLLLTAAILATVGLALLTPKRPRRTPR